MSLAVIHDVDRMMTWLGVGNVEGLLLRADPAAGALGHESLLLRRGVIGSRLPALQPSRLRLAPGDTLIFATDGVRSDFTRSLRRTDRPQQIADRVLARHGKETDDALVVAVRFAEASRS